MCNDFFSVLHILEAGGNPTPPTANEYTLNEYIFPTAKEYALPTAEEYSKMAQELVFKYNSQWSEPKYQCPKCGGGMRRNEMVVLTSCPPKYEYKCNKCGHVDYQYM